jgi:protein-disulfide isomerase
MTAGRKTVVSPPPSRRERRAEQRAERVAQRGGAHTGGKKSIWRSPIVVFTVGALVVGALVVGYALLTRPNVSTDSLSAPVAEVPAGLSDGRTLGRVGAPVTVDIWADFQCPGCGQLARRVEPPLITQFAVPGMASFVFHDAAFQGARAGNSWDESVESGAAARCAADQGMFWEMHDWLFANQIGENVGSFTPDRLRAIAQAAGLDMAAYDTCMASNSYAADVRSETTQGVNMGIVQTPTLIINGALYTGPMTVKDIGDAIVAAAGGAAPATAAAPTPVPPTP